MTYLALQILRAGVTTGFVPQIFGQDDEWRRNKEHYVGQLPHNLPYWLCAVSQRRKLQVIVWQVTDARFIFAPVPLKEKKFSSSV
ncbi:hypothetical protein E2C01_012028 [Portunus trituberculatus]|uniref:Uncharacterized protein n=1 Tax=Portunus trituberculatus TaxID=210409 RepID=A0A5B7DCR4_PORTR|nr:hypothetical protein [Portunus trituberculatus]